MSCLCLSILILVCMLCVCPLVFLCVYPSVCLLVCLSACVLFLCVGLFLPLKTLLHGSRVSEWSVSMDFICISCLVCVCVCVCFAACKSQVNIVLPAVICLWAHAVSMLTLVSCVFSSVYRLLQDVLCSRNISDTAWIFPKAVCG